MCQEFDLLLLYFSDALLLARRRAFLLLHRLNERFKFLDKSFEGAPELRGVNIVGRIFEKQGVVGRRLRQLRFKQVPRDAHRDPLEVI